MRSMLVRSGSIFPGPGADEIPLVQNGLGVSVLSTSRGIMVDREARRQHVGGEILCSLW